MKKVISILMSLFIVGFIVMTQAESISAQEDIGRLLKQVEDDSDRFSNAATKALDSSRYDGTATEDQMVRFVRDFEDSIDRLKKAYDKGNEALIPAKEVQARAKTIDKFLKKNNLGGTVSTDWGTVKIGLARLARAYKLKPIA